LIALLAIGLVVAAIYYVTRSNTPPAQQPQPNVVYVNPNASAPAAPAP
jgi:hypothetical protein